ncbi:MAG TPA: hypothetical protein VH140_06910 [Candidatus Acidoferrum sp.]|nr:hypothetical protein [Candidatus Acidoferrum sp.]
MNTFKHLVGVAALALIFCAGASADTLELKDGRVVQGRYLGGTRVIVRFEVEGDVQTFRVSEVSAVRLDRRSGRDRDDNLPPNGPYEGAPPPDQGQPNDQGGPPPNADNGRNDGPPPQDQGRPSDYPPPQAPPDQGRPNDYPPPPDRDRDHDRDRDYDRDRDGESHHYVYAAPGTPVTLPAGEPILVRMIDPVDSKRNVVGDVFKANLETDLAVNNVLVARRGSDAYVRLAYAKEARGLSGSSELQLELTRIIIDGREFPVVSGDYTMKGKGRGGDTAKKVGGGAIVGAIIGGVAGGGTGAAIGAGVGGAAGAGAEILTRGHAVRVPSETLLEFRLDQPVTVTPTQR